MIKCIIRIAAWMTGQTSIIVIHIPAYSLVAVICFRVFMANRTGVFCIIIGVQMAFRAFLPFAHVCTAVNGEVGRIMIDVFRWHPVRVGCMACRTVIRESRSDMIGIQGIVKIRLVATVANRRSTGKIAGSVTLFTI